MNTGVISSRYARTLLKYVLHTGHGEQVFAQVRSLLRDPDSLSSMKMDENLEEFVRLLSSHGRLDYARMVFITFVHMYCEQQGIRLVSLRSAVPAPELAERLSRVIGRKTGCRVLMDSEVDPDLVGGFVFEVDGRRLDASVRGQLDRISRQFTENNRRIV